MLTEDLKLISTFFLFCEFIYIMTKDKRVNKKGVLGLIERGGNALPHPASLFGILALTVLVLSLVGYLFHWNAIHPATGETVNTINLLSKDGLHRILLDMVENYTGFAPLGIVMVAFLGIGIAESSGLISASIRLLVAKAPASMLTFVIVLAGILSNIASDLGYVLIIPLGGIIFHSVGQASYCRTGSSICRSIGGF